MAGNPLHDLRPDLLAKIGSIVGHVEELRSPHGNERFDGGAIDGLLSDPQVQAWLTDMRALALIPQPRNRKS
jgi:hypothetical protein